MRIFLKSSSEIWYCREWALQENSCSWWQEGEATLNIYQDWLLSQQQLRWFWRENWKLSWMLDINTTSVTRAPDYLHYLPVRWPTVRVDMHKFKRVKNSQLILQQTNNHHVTRRNLNAKIWTNISLTILTVPIIDHLTKRQREFLWSLRQFLRESFAAKHVFSWRKN